MTHPYFADELVLPVRDMRPLRMSRSNSPHGRRPPERTASMIVLPGARITASSLPLNIGIEDRTRIDRSDGGHGVDPRYPLFFFSVLILCSPAAARTKPGGLSPCPGDALLYPLTPSRNPGPLAFESRRCVIRVPPPRSPQGPGESQTAPGRRINDRSPAVLDCGTAVLRLEAALLRPALVPAANGRPLDPRPARIDAPVTTSVQNCQRTLCRPGIDRMPNSQ